MFQYNRLMLFTITTIFCSSAIAQDRTEIEERNEYESDGTYIKKTNYKSEERYLGFAPAFALYGSLIDTTNEPGYGAGGKIEMPLVDILKLEVRGGWLTDVKVGDSNVDTDVVPVDLGLALHIPGRLFDRFRENNVRPIILGGATWAYLDLDKGYGSDDDWGWYSGGGVEIGDERGMGFLAEVIYRGGLDVSSNGLNDDIDGVMGNVGFYSRW